MRESETDFPPALEGREHSESIFLWEKFPSLLCTCEIVSTTTLLDLSDLKGGEILTLDSSVFPPEPFGGRTPEVDLDLSTWAVDAGLKLPVLLCP